MTEDARLLAILDAHGKSFLDSFGPIAANSLGKRKADGESPRAKSKKSRKSPSPDQDEGNEDEDEWTGINQGTNSEEDSDSEDYDTDGSDFEHTDDEFTGETTQSANVVVFSENIPKKTLDDKAQRKAFMSSKVSKLVSGSSQPSTSKRPKTAKEEEEDKTNAQNDALLHKLVHTKLLSGSLNPDLDMDGAKKRKALAGRVLELSGSAKLGKGEKSVREAERTKASKRVREGLVKKQEQRNKQELEEAKNLGNYHPMLKKMYEASSSGPSRKRQKGLKLGVGSFQGGVLKLSKSDVSSVMPGQSSTRGKKGKPRR
ncbi:hypothetical protein CVT24_008324 [Panaeolus cyanescens]|uniref:Uncharacterized protein n=1 Tax=Panaeolus cyanescens TaxID=181874 RepID=A0A409VEY7_9AGAR|nr:hypothetical protein CVT24_008324 [Panaeolus cyanescens]